MGSFETPFGTGKAGRYMPTLGGRITPTRDKAQEKERRRQKAARTRAKNKAAKEATSAAPASGPAVEACPPWADFADYLPDESAPWD